MSPNQNTSDDTRSRRQSDTVSPDTTASSDNADGSAQTISSPAALNIRLQLPSLVTTDAQNIQTRGQDAKDTTALPTPANGMRDSEREEISNRIQVIQNSAVGLQTRIEATDSQELMQQVHAHIRPTSFHRMGRRISGLSRRTGVILILPLEHEARSTEI
jgi:hypothetical protein